MNHLINIREMELEDLSPVFALGERLFTAEKWPNLYRTWDEYELLNLFVTDGDYCLVAELDGKLMGFVLGTVIQKRRNAWRYGYLIWIGVSPDVKQKGIGTRLLNRLTDLFIEKGVRMMMVDTEVNNQAAIKFFRREGFGQEVQHIYLTRNLSSHPDYVRKKASESESAGKPVPLAKSAPIPKSVVTEKKRHKKKKLAKKKKIGKKKKDGKKKSDKKKDRK